MLKKKKNSQETRHTHRKVFIAALSRSNHTFRVLLRPSLQRQKTTSAESGFQMDTRTQNQEVTAAVRKRLMKDATYLASKSRNTTFGPWDVRVTQVQVFPRCHRWTILNSHERDFLGRGLARWAERIRSFQTIQFFGISWYRKIKSVSLLGGAGGCYVKCQNKTFQHDRRSFKQLWQEVCGQVRRGPPSLPVQCCIISTVTYIRVPHVIRTQMLDQVITDCQQINK